MAITNEKEAKDFADIIFNVSQNPDTETIRQQYLDRLIFYLSTGGSGGFEGEARTGTTLVFDKASAFYNAATPSSSTSITLDETNPIIGATASFYSDGAAEVIPTNNSSIYEISGSFVPGKKNVYHFYWDGNKFMGNIQVGDDFTPPLPAPNILFEETYDGTTIDTNKWDVTNPDNTVITFVQNENLTAQSTGPSTSISSALNFKASDLDFDLSSGTTVLSFDIRCLKQDTFGGWSIGFSSYPNGGDDFISVFSPAGDTGNFIRLQAQEDASDVIALTTPALNIESAFVSFKVLITPADTTIYTWSTGLEQWDELATASNTWGTTNMKIRIGHGHNNADSDQNRAIYDNIFVTDGDFVEQYPPNTI